jgi:hypothetical protein
MPNKHVNLTQQEADELFCNTLALIEGIEIITTAAQNGVPVDEKAFPHLFRLSVMAKNNMETLQKNNTSLFNTLNV